MQTHYKIIWSQTSLTDLCRLHDFIEPHNHIAAKKAANRITSTIDLIADNPKMGVFLEDNRRQEFYPTFGKSGYVVRYYTNHKEKNIVILRIWHKKIANVVQISVVSHCLAVDRLAVDLQLPFQLHHQSCAAW